MVYVSDESEISKSSVELLYAKILGLTSPNSPRDTLVIPTGNGFKLLALYKVVDNLKLLSSTLMM